MGDIRQVVITVDAIKPELTGIGRYTWEVAAGAAALGYIDKVSYFDRGKFVGNLHDLRQGIRPPKDPWILRKMTQWRRSAFPGRPLFPGAVFHSTNFFLPAGIENGVVTIHDVSVLKFPETHPQDRIRQYENHFADTLKRTAHVITVSEHAKSEIVSLLGLDADRVTAIHLGVDDSFRQAGQDLLSSTGGLPEYDLKKAGYTLCVSTLEPRKNIDKLIDAYSLLPESVRRQYPLVLAGAVGWLAEGLQQQIARLSDEGWLRVLGYVPESLLPMLYANARLFAYPSRYEGFGLPVAEAMAARVPVVTSDQASLPEIGGGATAVIDPNDPHAFAEALHRGLEDDDWRRQAIAQGVEVAAGYSWQDCVRRTGEIYRLVAASH